MHIYWLRLPWSFCPHRNSRSPGKNFNSRACSRNPDKELYLSWRNVNNMANPSRSMDSLKGFCTTKAKALDDFLGSVKDRDITSDDVTTIKKLRWALEEQFDRMHLKCEAFITADVDPFENDGVYKKCKKDYEKSQVLVNKDMVCPRLRWIERCLMVHLKLRVLPAQLASRLMRLSIWKSS